MKIKELKEMIDGLDDEMEVMIPLPFKDDTLLISPCMDESGQMELTMDNGEEEMAFCLVCEGFFDDLDFEIFDPTLN